MAACRLCLCMMAIRTVVEPFELRYELACNMSVFVGLRVGMFVRWRCPNAVANCA